MEEETQVTYELHYDAGHGWLKVSMAEIIKLGIRGVPLKLQED